MKKVSKVQDNTVLEELLQRAYDDEVKAYATYSAVVEKFGEVLPFAHIIEAEKTHQAALLSVASAYNITLVSPEPASIVLPNTLRECCELGVAAEIGNIQLYTELLLHVNDFPEVQDLFYRLQAASYNNHLPAFRNGVVTYATPNLEAKAADPMAALEGMMGQWGELGQMAQKIARGEVNQEEITKLLSTNVSFVVGALLGAVGASVLGGVIAPDETAKTEDEKSEA